MTVYLSIQSLSVQEENEKLPHPTLLLYKNHIDVQGEFFDAERQDHSLFYRYLPLFSFSK